MRSPGGSMGRAFLGVEAPINLRTLKALGAEDDKTPRAISIVPLGPSSPRLWVVPEACGCWLLFEHSMGT